MASTDRHPEQDISLTDGSTTVAGNIVNNQGTEDPLNFHTTQQPRVSLKMYQGGTQHSDTEPPYRSIEKRDYSGGRGIDIFEQDATRFDASYRLETWREGRVVLASEEQYATGVRATTEEAWWQDNADSAYDLARVAIYGDQALYSRKFTPSDNITPKYVYYALDDVWTGDWSAIGTQARIYSDDGGGKPNALLFVSTGVNSTTYPGVVRSDFINATQLNSGTDYHIVFVGAVAGDSTTHNVIYAGDDVDASTAYKSTDGSSWSAATKGLFFRIVPDEDPFDMFPFEHYGSQYVVLSYRDHDNNDPRVFMNGDRGTVSSMSSSATTSLIDTSKSWTTDEWAGSIVRLHSGPGADDSAPWRLISSNDGDTLTVTPAWESMPRELTKYAIVNSNKWTEKADHGLTRKITDVLVSGNIVYVCRGDFDDIFHMFDDTWTMEVGNRGSYITEAIDTETGNRTIFLARAGWPPMIFSAAPVWSENNLDISDLDFESSMAVELKEPDFYDGDMESDSLLWEQVGDCSQQRQAEDDELGTKVYQGFYARWVQNCGNNEGFKQTLSVKSGTTYHITCRVLIHADFLSGGVDVTFDNKVIGAVSGISGMFMWNLIEGFVTTTSASVDLKFLGTKTFNDFFVDAVRIERIATYLTQFGDERITNVLPFGPDSQLHVITTGGIYREWRGDYYKISPAEMSGAKDDRNGVAALEHGPYLFMSFLDGVGRYSSGGQGTGRLDQVGQNLDEGMPANQRGNIVSLVGYPERMYAALDGGSSNYSTILLYNGLGWHEVYRAPATGMRITSLYIQTLPDTYVDRLWFNEGSDIAWIGVDLNPIENSKYRYCPFGYVRLPNIYLEQREVDKHWSTIKITGRDNDGNDLSTSNYIIATYTTSAGVTIMIGIFDASESHSIDYTGKYVNDPRIQLLTDNSLETPQLDAVTIDCLEHLPVKWAYTWQMRLSDDQETHAGKETRTTLATQIANTKSLTDSAAPVTMTNNRHPHADGNSMKLLTSEFSPVMVDQTTQRRSVIVSCTAIDV